MEVNAMIYRAINNLEETPRKYSGRGMYGKECLAVTVENPTNFFIDLTVEIFSICEDIGEDPYRFIEKLKNHRLDSMGRSATVVYWPSLAWDDSFKSREACKECDAYETLNEEGLCYNCSEN